MSYQSENLLVTIGGRYFRITVQIERGWSARARVDCYGVSEHDKRRRRRYDSHAK